MLFVRYFLKEHVDYHRLRTKQDFGSKVQYIMAETIPSEWFVDIEFIFCDTAPKNELDKISKSTDLKQILLPKHLKMQKIGHFAQVRLCITDYMCMIIINGILYCVSK